MPYLFLHIKYYRLILFFSNLKNVWWVYQSLKKVTWYSLNWIYYNVFHSTKSDIVWCISPDQVKYIWVYWESHITVFSLVMEVIIAVSIYHMPSIILSRTSHVFTYLILLTTLWSSNYYVPVLKTRSWGIEIKATYWRLNS